MEKPSGDSVTIKNLSFTPFFTPLKKIHHIMHRGQRYKTYNVGLECTYFSATGNCMVCIFAYGFHQKSLHISDFTRSLAISHLFHIYFKKFYHITLLLKCFKNKYGLHRFFHTFFGDFTPFFNTFFIKIFRSALLYSDTQFKKKGVGRYLRMFSNFGWLHCDAFGWLHWSHL